MNARIAGQKAKDETQHRWQNRAGCGLPLYGATSDLADRYRVD
jgi:hypothetical protein